MALQSDYTAGTITVGANGTAVTGTGTGWLTAGFQEGDLLFANGWVGVVLSVNSNTSLTLAQPWRGGALNGAPYRLRYQSDGSRFSAQARQLIDFLGGGDGNFEAFAGLVGAANRVPYFTGAGTMNLTALTPWARTFLDDVDSTSAYGTLGIVPEAQLPGRIRGLTPSITDWNTATASGFYNCGTGAANGPTSNTSVGFVFERAGVHCVQIVSPLSNGDIYTRIRVSETWGPWFRIYTSNSLIGTVSQSGGVPSGAAMERGNNSNGFYERLANGTQICTTRGVTFSYSDANVLRYDWPYPAGFITAPVLSVLLPNAGVNQINLSFNDIGCLRNSASASQGAILITRCAGAAAFASNSGVSDCSIVAIGRWF